MGRVVPMSRPTRHRHPFAFNFIVSVRTVPKRIGAAPSSGGPLAGTCEQRRFERGTGQYKSTATRRVKAYTPSQESLVEEGTTVWLNRLNISKRET